MQSSSAFAIECTDLAILELALSYCHLYYNAKIVDAPDFFITNLAFSHFALFQKQLLSFQL